METRSDSAIVDRDDSGSKLQFECRVHRADTLTMQSYPDGGVEIGVKYAGEEWRGIVLSKEDMLRLMIWNLDRLSGKAG